MPGTEVRTACSIPAKAAVKAVLSGSKIKAGMLNGEDVVIRW